MLETTAQHPHVLTTPDAIPREREEREREGASFRIEGVCACRKRCVYVCMAWKGCGSAPLGTGVVLFTSAPVALKQCPVSMHSCQTPSPQAIVKANHVGNDRTTPP